MTATETNGPAVKVCPSCALEIPQAAIRCPHCRANVNPKVPQIQRLTFPIGALLIIVSVACALALPVKIGGDSCGTPLRADQTAINIHYDRSVSGSDSDSAAIQELDSLQGDLASALEVECPRERRNRLVLFGVLGGTGIVIAVAGDAWVRWAKRRRVASA